jgi:acetaldehyde dehydrogenase (acetylating)
VILEFGLKKPAFRIVVNTPTTHGSIGLTTGLDPAMTLGCGGYGGNITSDNISPRHLLNVKRLAYEVAPAASRFEESPPRAVTVATSAPHHDGIPAVALTRRIDEFLAAKGFRGTSGAPTVPSSGAGSGTASPAPVSAPSSAPLDFVCEEDVRRAIQTGRTLVLTERAIVTPAARDLGEQHRVFRPAPWPE